MTAPPTRHAVLHAIVAWTGGALFVISLLWFLYSYFVRFGRVATDGTVVEPLLIDAGLFAIFALHHSVLARARARAAVARVLPPQLERSSYTWIASLLFIGVCVLWQPVPGVLYDVRGPWSWLLYAVQATGVFLTARASAAIGTLDLAGVRQVRDAQHGRQPRHAPLETRGLYGFVRHPLYFAWVLVVFGTPGMTATRAVFAVMSTLYLAAAIPLEERSLLQTFGAEYERYRRKVRWRMLPGLY